MSRFEAKKCGPRITRIDANVYGMLLAVAMLLLGDWFVPAVQAQQLNAKVPAEESDAEAEARRLLA